MAGACKGLAAYPAGHIRRIIHEESRSKDLESDTRCYGFLDYLVSYGT
jgi:hypothetical protein